MELDEIKTEIDEIKKKLSLMMNDNNEIHLDCGFYD